MPESELFANDTICALATAPGGPVAIIRISGTDAIACADKLWHGHLSLQDDHPRLLKLGVLQQPDGTILDAECLAVKMPGPHSYTGEDVVELQCHGGPFAARLTLAALQMLGVRMAGPGEFTRRTFLHGRLDLTQAEAVAEMITASSAAALRLANQQMAGELGQKLRAFYSSLSNVLTEIESRMDFPEEDLDWVPSEQLLGTVEKIRDESSELAATARTGEILRGALSVAIAGQPNVGKSSLLNKLLGRARAIVSDIPGTTRDTIEAELTLRGIPIRVIDTAGLRQGTDDIERQGIERSQQTIEQADIVLWLVDATAANPQSQDFPASNQAKLIQIANKSDLPGAKAFPGFIAASALTGQGLDAICDAIENHVWQGKDARQSDFAVSARHGELLRQASSALAATVQELSQEAWELAAIQLRTALANLGRITGQAVEPDILGQIFHKFCIGK